MRRTHRLDARPIFICLLIFLTLLPLQGQTGDGPARQRAMHETSTGERPQARHADEHEDDDDKDDDRDDDDDHDEDDRDDEPRRLRERTNARPQDPAKVRIPEAVEGEDERHGKRKEKHEDKHHRTSKGRKHD